MILKCFTSVSASASSHQCTAASFLAHQTKNLEEDEQKQGCEDKFFDKRKQWDAEEQV